MSDGKENVTRTEDLFLLTSVFFEVGCRSLIVSKFTCGTNEDVLSFTLRNRGTPRASFGNHENLPRRKKLRT